MGWPEGVVISATVAEISNLLSKRDYKKLLTDLQRIIREGKEEAGRAAAQALTESYWSIGKRHRPRLRSRL
jgi:vacuolar-type H+-ATPase subunit C/Vma6